MGIRFKGLRHVGSVRFCRRSDVDGSSFGYCTLEEIHGSQPAPGDIIMMVKASMADANPYRCCTVMTAIEASALRIGAQQPRGVAERRVIANNVVRNLETYAPRCREQGIISRRAESYLLDWTAGRLAKEPRPTRYSIINYRQNTPSAHTGLHVTPDWSEKLRHKNWQLKPLGSNDPDTSDSGDDFGQIVLGD